MTKRKSVLKTLARLLKLRVQEFLVFCGVLAMVVVMVVAISLPGAIVGFLYAWINADELLKCGLLGGTASFMLVAMGYGIYDWVKKLRKDYETCREDAE